MVRPLGSLSVLALLLWSCGPDSRTCSGPHPDFKVVLKLTTGPLPADTVVHVTYAGSGVENFRLSERNAPHEVAFCQVADQNGVPLDPATANGAGASAMAGAAGAAADSSDEPSETVASLYCEFWTAGFTQIKVSGSGFVTMAYDLAPKEGLCTVAEQIVLDSPDAG